MPDSIRQQLRPGAKVTVTQHIPHGNKDWSQDVSGTIVGFEQRRTGSWFAHSKDDKLWLDRLVIRKADGELTTLNLDEFSQLHIEPPAAEKTPAEAVAKSG
jgi:hypothetical protein